MKLLKHIPSLLLAGGLTATILGCARSEAATETDTATAGIGGGEAPQAIALVTRAVANGDAPGFAATVVYPLPRPYPLKDIKDSVEMVEYYPVLVDDSLRNVIANARPERWNENGYRGWTLDNGEYIWIDDSIYSVNYTSVAEQALRAMLAREEIESLAQPMRVGWTPAFCLYGVEDGTIYRVDMSLPEEEIVSEDVAGDTIDVKVYPDAAASNDSCTYRLAVYKRGDDLRGQPSTLMTGHLAIEGSEGVRVYYFNDTEGDTAEYVYDQIADEELPEIVIVSHGGKPRHDKVKRAYWRDYLSRKR